jgi:hypothetical protein
MRTAVTTLLLMLCLVACGASARERTLAAALTTTNASRDAFVAFDLEFQRSIVANAKDLESGRRALDDYRKKRESLVQGFALVYQLIATAALASDQPSIAEMLRALQQLKRALDALKGPQT